MKAIIGLTGGYCSGKNEAGRFIEEEGFRIIDVDKLGHKALELKATTLAETFGTGILDSDGRVNRKALGAIVFSDPEALKRHEAIIHPAMLRLLDEELRLGDRSCINAALLYRFPQLGVCSLVLEITSPLYLRIKRGRKRDGLGPLAVLKRIASQRALWKQRPKAEPPVVFISNAGNIPMLRAEVKRALASLTS